MSQNFPIQMESPRDLTENERKDFKELYYHIVQKNPIHQRNIYALIYPVYIIFLLIITINTYTSITTFISGILSIQLHFGFSHMWAHSLMMYYKLWNVESMISNAPIVLFYAHYHHHHKNKDNWMSELSYGSYKVAIAHWNSYSLLTTNFPINGYIVKLFVILSLYYNTAKAAPFYLMYEIGVIFLPIAHDWVHKRQSLNFFWYFILSFKIFGILWYICIERYT